MKKNTPVIYFDGECALCTGVVQFLLKRDTKNIFRFASLQGKAGRNLFLSDDEKDSFILAEGDKIYSRSTGALNMFRLLGHGWQIMYLFIFIPKSIRDGVYNFISKNRYKWFGKRETCWMPDAKWSEKFLE